MRGLKENVAVIGVGGCGTNIAYLFEKYGYTTIHINSSVQDESAIEKAKVVKHLEGFNGCAGDREKAMKAIAKNQTLIDDITKLKEEVFFIAFSAGGGTGSGISPTLASIIAEETEKTVCCIVVLPGSDEDMGYQKNAYDCVKELSELDNIGCTFFIDNGTGNNKKSVINNRFATMLHAFISNDSVSAYGNVDEEEKRTMLAQNGSMILSVLQGDCDTDRAVESLTTNNIFAPTQRDGKCEYIAIINNKSNGIEKEPIAKLLGTPKRTFVGYGSKEIIIAASGLTFPFDHVKNIGSSAMKKNEERKASRRELVGLDDLNLDEPKKKVTEEKKRSSRDALLKLVSGN